MLPPRLNLACGADYRPGYWNVDGGPFRVDEAVDVFGALPWPSGAFQEILANDILEHTSWAHTERVLSEWLRVLAPGGRLVLRVPNLRFLCEWYLSGALDAKGASLWIYGGQESSHGVGQEFWRLNAHYAAFDEARLRALCQDFALTIESLTEAGTNLVLSAVKTMHAFDFSGQRYAYVDHPYNATSHNERRVELPIIWAEVLRGGRPVLEIGNVLSHYFALEHHTVVDKYEAAPGVIALDVVDVESLGKKFPLIVSISTLEHVGFDEPAPDPDKIGRALDALKRCLTPDGRLAFTIPCGYNPSADAFVKRRGDLSVRYMRRVSPENTWRECDPPELALYGAPYPFANVVAFCVAH